MAAPAIGANGLHKLEHKLSDSGEIMLCWQSTGNLLHLAAVANSTQLARFLAKQLEQLNPTTLSCARGVLAQLVERRLQVLLLRCGLVGAIESAEAWGKKHRKTGILHALTHSAHAVQVLSCVSPRASVYVVSKRQKSHGLQIIVPRAGWSPRPARPTS